MTLRFPIALLIVPVVFFCVVFGTTLMQPSLLRWLHPHAKIPVVHETVIEAEDIDFLMHDMEVAKEQARDAYERITAADRIIADANHRVMFDERSLRDMP